MVSRVLTHDWSATPLGAIESWSRSRRGIVDMVLGGALPMMALCGPGLIQIYDDGTAPSWVAGILIVSVKPRGSVGPKRGTATIRSIDR